MDNKQYNQSIDYALRHDKSRMMGDGFAVARTIFDYLGTPFPRGTAQETFAAIKNNLCNGWKACTLKEVQQAANRGEAAIGINANRMVVFAAMNAEPIISTSSVIYLSDDLLAADIADLEFYAYHPDSVQ
jgi:hypothetical protein